MDAIDPRPSARGGWWRTLIFTAAAAGMTAAAALVMFSAFMYYDDEGYVLISLRNFAEHGGLYREVYSQYGPFPFVLYYLMHGLGLPFTHVAGRLVTLAAWAGTALCVASLVWQGTRRFAASLVALVAVFPYLWIMVSEPSHPGGLVAALVAVAAALGYRWIRQGRTLPWGVLVGAIAAALALTKINVGGFVVCAGLAWMLIHHESQSVRRWGPAVLAAGAVLLPLALMRPMLATGWVQTYALVFAASALGAIAVTRRGVATTAAWRTLAACVGSGALVAGVVVAVVLARGTTLLEIVDGILLGPLKHPGAYNLRYTWAGGTAAFALASLAACGAALLARRRGWAPVDPIVAGLRLAAATGAAYAVLQYPASSPDRIVFGFAAPCLWVFLWPLPGENPAAKAALSWVGLLGLGQFLHAFPVAGSQIAWGTYLALPVAMIGAWEALAWLDGRFAAAVMRLRRRIVAALQIAAALLTIAIGARFAEAAGRYRQGADLGLPGAELLRLPTEATALFRLLSLNATVHGDLVFSEPGMFSFNLWTGLPTPTLANVTHWFSLLNGPRQAAIVAALEAHPRACVILQREHIAYLVRHGFAPAGVLHDYIARNFVPAFTLDGFEFCVRRGRTIEPLHVGEMLVQSDARDTANTTLRLRVLLPPGARIARIAVTAPQVPQGEALSFHAGNARVEVVSGAAPAVPVAWPLPTDGPATLLVHFDRFRQPRPTAGGVITLYDPDGAEIALARLKQ